MSVFKIGGSSIRPMSGASGGAKTEKKTAQDPSPSKSGFDTASINANPLAVMPRMSLIRENSAQHLQGETVETLLRNSAAELDDYFTAGYGFDEKPE